MAVISTEHTARKRHHCSAPGCRIIQPGERYRRHVATPNDGEVGNTAWWHLNECTDCATRYGRPIGPAVNNQHTSRCDFCGHFMSWDRWSSFNCFAAYSFAWCAQPDCVAKADVENERRAELRRYRRAA